VRLVGFRDDFIQMLILRLDDFVSGVCLVLEIAGPA
jgi:hypothetical protein